MIYIYTTATCRYCPSVKKYLDSKKAKYKVVDCTENPELLKPAVKLSGVYTVPQTRKGDQIVVGLNYGKLKELIMVDDKDIKNA